MSTETSHFAFERVSSEYWRVSFDHPPINALTADTVAELQSWSARSNGDPALTVVVFTSANPDFFLAHYDTEGDPGKTVSMAPGPTGMHPWLDLTARLSRAPLVTISSIAAAPARRPRVHARHRHPLRRRPRDPWPVRGRRRPVPGGGPMARLSAWSAAAARSRSCSAPTTSLPPSPSATATSTASCPPRRSRRRPTELARRIASFDKQALAEVKAFVNATTLPADTELPPALQAFFASATRPATQARLANLVAQGYGRDSDLERRLGELVTLPRARRRPAA